MNIAEILKDCIRGTKLYSPIWGNVLLRRIEPLDGNDKGVIVIEEKGDGVTHELFSNGSYSLQGECVLFPSKDQRNWNKFRLPLKKNITYKEVCKNLFSKDKFNFYLTDNGGIDGGMLNATNSKQLKRILTLNKLLNIAEYYNRLHIMIDKQYVILYDKGVHEYIIKPISPCYRHGIEVGFNRAEDAKAVIDNPNFREILDTIYK